MASLNQTGAVPCPRCEATVGPDDVTCGSCGASRVVCGHFRITKLLGRGGMGRIYEAVSESTGERVAVKLLALGTATDWLLRDLFERSTNILMGLSHPALPKVHAFEQDDAGRFVLVRDGFDGGTLQERILKRDRRLAPDDVRRLLEALLDLLVYLQSRVPPVIHRDIKPSNVMFRTDADDAPVLVDFDTVAAPEGQRTGVTIVGTPGYTAPEQFAGEASPSTDVYSLGTTMLFVVTHVEADHLPRAVGRFDVAAALAPLDSATRRVLARMTEFDRGKRYENAAGALEDLRRGDRDGERDREREHARERERDHEHDRDLERDVRRDSYSAPSSASLPMRRISPLILPIVLACAAVGTVTFRLIHTSRPAIALTAPPTAKATTTAKPPPPPHHCKWLDVTDCTAQCSNHDAQSCSYLGSAYETGRGGAIKDVARASALFNEACDGAYGNGCARLGFQYEQGRALAKDQDRAVALYTRACDLGDGYGCTMLGVDLEHGTGVAKDAARAATFYQKACDSSYSLGCSNLGYLYEIGSGVTTDGARAASLYNQGCVAGDGHGCANYGTMYENGTFVAKDVDRAGTLYKRACDVGNMAGCSNLGLLYEKGTGMPKDAVRAVSLFEQSCNGGGMPGCANLGRMYQNAIGVPKYDVRAMALYTQACEGGNGLGCASLGYRYEKGTGVDKDLPRAAALYTKGCDAGNAIGCSNLGSLYEHGTGVPVDRAKAVGLYRQGCKGRNDWGCTQLKRLGEPR